MIDRRILNIWIQASRPSYFVATFIPLGIGWIMAAQEGPLRPVRFLLVFVACFLVHLGTNLSNDYFDHMQGADVGDAIGGSRVLQEGKISVGALWRAILLTYGVATVIGSYIVIGFDLWGIFPVALFALFSSIFYVAPPIKYGYRGLGELFVSVNMGPVMVVGAYWVIAGHPDWAPFFVSIPVGIMVAGIMYYQNLPDMKTDILAGKRTLAVRLGKRGAFIGFIVQWVLTYLSIVLLVLGGLLTPWAFLSLLTVPLFMKMVLLIKNTEDWMELNDYGPNIRLLYLLNGIAMIVSLLLA